MIKGFKDFLFRGNVIDLAVAVAIGTAFTALVTAVVKNLIEPIVNVFAGNSINGLSWTIIGDNPKTTIDFAAIITAFIAFASTAAAIYFFVVVPVKAINDRRRRGEEPPAEDVAPPSEDVVLLTQIRDLLAAQQGPRL
jgi:large conductance mechanosensitive channel